MQVQYSTVQYSTVQYSTVQYGAVRTLLDPCHSRSWEPYGAVGNTIQGVRSKSNREGQEEEQVE
jgi:hypothetical protein